MIEACREEKTMASSREYLDFIMEQLAPAGGISHRAMMGEYILYRDGKIVGGIYDDRLLVKPTASARRLMPDAAEEIPYPGAKPMLLVDNVDDREFLCGLIGAVAAELPAPKKNADRAGPGKGEHMLDIARLSGRYAVRRMTGADVRDILDFCRQNELYYRYCGSEPSRGSVENDLHVTPPGVGPEDKYYVGFFENGTLAAVMDLIDGYPDPDTAFIGFFMINAALQGKGIGSGIVREACGYLKETGKTRVRLAFAEDNPQAGHFWKKNGFAVTGRAPMDGWMALVAERTL